MIVFFDAEKKAYDKNILIVKLIKTLRLAPLPMFILALIGIFVDIIGNDQNIIDAIGVKSLVLYVIIMLVIVIMIDLALTYLMHRLDERDYLIIGK